MHYEGGFMRAMIRLLSHYICITLWILIALWSSLIFVSFACNLWEVVFFIKNFQELLHNHFPVVPQFLETHRQDFIPGGYYIVPSKIPLCFILACFVLSVARNRYNIQNSVSNNQNFLNIN